MQVVRLLAQTVCKQGDRSSRILAARSWEAAHRPRTANADELDWPHLQRSASHARIVCRAHKLWIPPTWCGPSSVSLTVSVSDQQSKGARCAAKREGMVGAIRCRDAFHGAQLVFGRLWRCAEAQRSMGY